MPAFDLTLLAENWGTPEDALYQRILGLFMAEATRLAADIEAAVAADNRAVLQRATHTLRSTAGNICAMTLSNAAAALDDAANGTGDCTRLAADVAAAWAAVQAAVAAGGPRHGR